MLKYIDAARTIYHRILRRRRASRIKVDPGSRDREILRALRTVGVVVIEDYLDHDPIHLAFSGGCEEMDQLEEILKTKLGDTVKILGTKYIDQDFTLIDVVNPAASKGAGVAAAASELGVMSDEIMAIGDNYNDLEMLLFAGTGVVMANAPLSLREIAGLHPTASNTEDGVALAIEQFILNREQLINQ